MTNVRFEILFVLLTTFFRLKQQLPCGSDVLPSLIVRSYDVMKGHTDRWVTTEYYLIVNPVRQKNFDELLAFSDNPNRGGNVSCTVLHGSSRCSTGIATDMSQSAEIIENALYVLPKHANVYIFMLTSDHFQCQVDTPTTHR